jgi:hypothetical protein
MSIDPIGSVLCLDGTFFQVSLLEYHCDCVGYCVF